MSGDGFLTLCIQIMHKIDTYFALNKHLQQMLKIADWDFDFYEGSKIIFG